MHRVPSVTSLPGSAPPPARSGWTGAAHLDGPPTVTVGIPTFNRSSQLARAVASCRAQTYEPLEIVISDNASTDDTPRKCQEWRDADSRIIVLRQDQNIGREPNFGAVLSAASGEYFIWLSDDDWLDNGYIAACMEAFAQNPGCSMVGGTARYTLSSGENLYEAVIDLRDDDPAMRVAAYLAAVGLNGEYYGVMKRTAILECEYPITFAGDWYFVAQMAALGPIVALPTVEVHRSLTGASVDIDGLAGSYGLAPHWGYDLHLWALLLFVPAIMLGLGSFGAIPTRPRLTAATSITWTLLVRWRRHAVNLRTSIHRARSARARLLPSRAVKTHPAGGNV